MRNLIEQHSITHTEQSLAWRGMDLHARRRRRTTTTTRLPFPCLSFKALESINTNGELIITSPLSLVMIARAGAGGLLCWPGGGGAGER